MSQIIKIDIHGLFVEEALEKIQHCLATASKNTERIIVVHGYNRGTALKEAVHKIRSPRILKIESSFLNPGESYLWLK